MDHLKNASIDTRLIHTDRPLNPTSAVIVPIFQTANFRGDSAQDFANRAGEARHSEFYTRYGNPTLSQVESVLACARGRGFCISHGVGHGCGERDSVEHRQQG